MVSGILNWIVKGQEEVTRMSQSQSSGENAGSSSMAGEGFSMMETTTPTYSYQCQRIRDGDPRGTARPGPMLSEGRAGSALASPPLPHPREMPWWREGYNQGEGGFFDPVSYREHEWEQMPFHEPAGIEGAEERTHCSGYSPLEEDDDDSGGEKRGRGPGAIRRRRPKHRVRSMSLDDIFRGDKSRDVFLVQRLPSASVSSKESNSETEEEEDDDDY